MRVGQPSLITCTLVSLLTVALSRDLPAQTAPQYEVQELGSSAWGLTIANDINNRGLVVGEWDSGQSFGGPRHAVVWHEGEMIDLTTDPGVVFAAARGVNDTGLVTGFYNADGSILSGGFRWVRGQFEELPTFAPGFQEGFGVTESGLVLGRAMHEDFKIDATVWDQDLGIVDLGNLGGGSSIAYDGNGWGTIVGTSSLSFTQNNACRWIGDELVDMGTLPGHPIGRAYAINNHGEIVGFSGSAFDEHGFHWSAETGMVDLGDLGGPFGASATDINDDGVIVGFADTGSNRLGVVWHDFELFDLNSLLVNGQGWLIKSANGINELGQIVGHATHGGKQVAYVATPVDSPLTTLIGPSPGTAGTLNTIEIIEATPGAPIQVCLGTAAGESPVGGCGGAVVDIADPRSVLAVADESGAVTLTFSLPSAAQGTTLLVQAVDLSNCDVTNLGVRKLD